MVNNVGVNLDKYRTPIISTKMKVKCYITIYKDKDKKIGNLNRCIWNRIMDMQCKYMYMYVSIQFEFNALIIHLSMKITFLKIHDVMNC